MTRGRRRNRVTLSGPANGRKTDEVEIQGSDTLLIDDLAVRGFLTPVHTRAARTLIRDRSAMNERYVEALSRIPSAKQAHIIALLDQDEGLATYGRRIMGYRVVREAEQWSINALRGALADLAEVYSGKRGGKLVAYGSPERLDDDEGEE